MALLVSILYDIVVAPLVSVIELAFTLMLRLLGDPGWAVVGVSLVVNILCAPLYAMADAAQQAERDRQASMEHWVDHIKHTFKGDERYMMLSTYYRQRGYKQVYALSSSVSLLLQVPIFIAAYRCLSGLAALRGASFLGIPDLSAPDSLLTVGTTAVNVLPVLMTALNCLSTWVYTRDLRLADKLQAYGLAALFLVLLYKSPAGLVLYWTCNQVFSLVRNIVTKLLPKHETAGSPLADRLRGVRDALRAPEGTRTRLTFCLAASLLTVLVAVLVPSALMAASPDEFITASGFGAPLQIVGHCLCVFGGLFVLWVGVYHALADEDGKRAIAFCLALVACCAVVDYFLFAGDLGIITAALTYETDPTFDSSLMLANAGTLVALALVFSVAWRYAHGVVNPLLAILLLGVTILSAPNLASLYGASGRVAELQAQAQTVVTDEEAQADGEQAGVATTPIPFDESGDPLPVIHLSREGRNVVIIYLDRAIGAYVPYLLNEKPELAQVFDGFTYYPNTISYGTKTVFGSPAVMGGYEYTPAKLNERSDELLVDKHNESLRVMPTLFSQAGFDVTLFDTPLTNYKFSTYDYSVFDGIPNVKAYHSTSAYTDWYLRVGSKMRGTSEGEEVVIELGDTREAQLERFERDVCYYALFRVSPVFARTAIYDDGAYLAPPGSQETYGIPSPLARTTVATVVRPLLKTMARHAPDPSLVARITMEDLPTEEPEEQVVGYDEWGNPIYAEAEETSYDEWGNPIPNEEIVGYDEWGNPIYGVVEEEPVQMSAGEQVLTYGRTTDNVVNNEFLNYYSALAALPQITAFDGGEQGSFVFFGNSTTHTPDLVLVPDYVPSTVIDNSLYANQEAYTIDGHTLLLDTVSRQAHYQSNMAAWLRVGEWLDLLKAEGVYDNTRIILVSDHGHGLAQLDSLYFEGKLDAMNVNPLFAVKDFGAHGDLATDWQFMTNADCPVKALAGVVENPVNPFTGAPLDDAEKYAHDQLVTLSTLWDVREYQTGTVLDTFDASWFTVHDDIFSYDNWQFAWGY